MKWEWLWTNWLRWASAPVALWHERTRDGCRDDELSPDTLKQSAEHCAHEFTTTCTNQATKQCTCIPRHCNSHCANQTKMIIHCTPVSDSSVTYQSWCEWPLSLTVGENADGATCTFTCCTCTAGTRATQVTQLFDTVLCFVIACFVDKTKLTN